MLIGPPRRGCSHQARLSYFPAYCTNAHMPAHQGSHHHMQQPPLLLCGHAQTCVHNHCNSTPHQQATLTICLQTHPVLQTQATDQIIQLATQQHRHADQRRSWAAHPKYQTHIGINPFFFLFVLWFFFSPHLFFRRSCNNTPKHKVITRTPPTYNNSPFHSRQWVGCHLRIQPTATVHHIPISTDRHTITSQHAQTPNNNQ